MVHCCPATVNPCEESTLARSRPLLDFVRGRSLLDEAVYSFHIVFQRPKRHAARETAAHPPCACSSFDAQPAQSSAATDVGGELRLLLVGLDRVWGNLHDLSPHIESIQNTNGYF